MTSPFGRHPLRAELGGGADPGEECASDGASLPVRDCDHRLEVLKRLQERLEIAPPRILPATPEDLICEDRQR
jgi:hypothetical protein